MVDVDVQLLVGTAVTVFLAMVFFGVVVLWDVALALRSVGDKIDKLEDSIDDDLTDINHTIDGVPAGGSGTQLHLSGGGTISSGPSGPTAEAQQPQGSQQPRQQPGSAPVQGQPHQQHSGVASGAGPVHDRHGGTDPGPQVPNSGPGVDPGSPSGQPRDEQTDDADGEGDERVDQSQQAGDGEEAPDAVEDDAGDEESSTTDEHDPVDETDSDRSLESDLVDRNRNRFATSDDRIPWYARTIDTDATGAEEPTIAGELTDGSERTIDDTEVIAVGPPESTSEGAVEETDPSDDSTASTRSGADVADVERDVDATSTESAADSDGEHPTEGASDGPADRTLESSDSDDGVLEYDESDAGADATVSSESERDTPAGGADDTVADGTNDADVEPEMAVDVAPDDGNGADDADDVANDADDAMDEAGDTVGDDAPNDVDVPGDESAGDESAGEGSYESESVPVAEFGFDDVGELADDDLEEVTVEEAVDTMNEDAPVPELSGHQFDVTAEADEDDGAVLTFEFDTDTVDLSGSTERLLQYQMRSFAERDSTPDGDVSIGQRRIVIEIRDSDGAAITQWGDAAVSIIDRTLYLSDTSGE